MPQCIVTDAATKSRRKNAFARRVWEEMRHLRRRPLGHVTQGICSLAISYHLVHFFSNVWCIDLSAGS